MFHYTSKTTFCLLRVGLYPLAFKLRLAISNTGKRQLSTLLRASELRTVEFKISTD